MQSEGFPMSDCKTGMTDAGQNRLPEQGRAAGPASRADSDPAPHPAAALAPDLAREVAVLGARADSYDAKLIAHLEAARAQQEADRADHRRDMADFKAEVKGDMAEMRQDMADFKAEVKGDLAEMRQDMSDHKAELYKQFLHASIGVMAVGVAMMGIFFTMFGLYLRSVLPPATAAAPSSPVMIYGSPPPNGVAPSLPRFELQIPMAEPPAAVLEGETQVLEAEPPAAEPVAAAEPDGRGGC